jgi:hypothetical protein
VVWNPFQNIFTAIIVLDFFFRWFSSVSGREHLPFLPDPRVNVLEHWPKQPEHTSIQPKHVLRGYEAAGIWAQIPGGERQGERALNGDKWLALFFGCEGCRSTCRAFGFCLIKGHVDCGEKKKGCLHTNNLTTSQPLDLQADITVGPA